MINKQDYIRSNFRGKKLQICHRDYSIYIKNIFYTSKLFVSTNAMTSMTDIRRIVDNLLFQFFK